MVDAKNARSLLEWTWRSSGKRSGQTDPLNGLYAAWGNILVKVRGRLIGRLKTPGSHHLGYASSSSFTASSASACVKPRSSIKS